MDYPCCANYPSETDNSSCSVGLKRSMMVVMTVTIRKMDADNTILIMIMIVFDMM